MTSQTGNKRTRSVEHGGRHGFTLLELILVMAILIIVVTMTAVSLKPFFRGRALDSEARRLLALTRYGQSRAVSEGVPMVLWIDQQNGTYGLEIQQSYSDTDGKAKDFALEKDLQIEAVLPVTTATITSAMQPAATALFGNNVPTIRFTPDGFISETSPDTIYIRDADNTTVVIAQSRNRLNYEIQTSTVTAAAR